LKKKILIIGSSYSIKRIFIEKYKNVAEIIDFINFRDSWDKTYSINRYDLIIISGFHFYICYCSISLLNNYIERYVSYLNILKSKCSNVILLITYINTKKSFSRVVYFYYHLVKILRNRLILKEFDILTFRKIHFVRNTNFFCSIFRKLLESDLLNFNSSDFFKKNINKFKLKNIPKINFMFIRFPRTRLMDRILRIF